MSTENLDPEQERMQEVVAAFRHLVVETAGRLRRLTQDAVLVSRGEGKWTIQEILGHLVDSAANNHQRFVRGQFLDAVVFQRYEQDAWVATQRYQESSWPLLVGLWEAFNLHLAALMESIPEDIRLRPVPVGHIHEASRELFPEDNPLTLDYLMRDYVDHLKHHLRQIDPTLVAS